MPRDLFAALIAGGANMTVTMFQTHRRFGLGTKTSSSEDRIDVLCDRLAVLTTELVIRHGKTLTLRHVPWYVTAQEMTEPLLGRPILKALGLGTKEMLAAACDRLNGYVDIDAMMTKQKKVDFKVARVLMSGIFHSDSAVTDKVGAGNDDDLLEIGIDSEADIKSALSNLVIEAADNGLHGPHATMLRSLLAKYWDIPHSPRP